jgi:hypothetical protein
MVGGIVLLLPCGWCCTAALWGCTATDETVVSEATPAEEKGNVLFDAREPWTVWSVGKRTLLTPLTLGVDLLCWLLQLMDLTVSARRTAN